MEQKVECRITYSYGVNKRQTRTGFAPPEWLRNKVEQDTMGPVDLDKVEYRVVTYGDWEEEVKP